MASRRLSIVSVVVAGQALLFWATSYLPGLGVPFWHHLASLAAIIVLSFAIRKQLTRSRRFLALGVLALSLVAAVSGFWLLYWKEGIRLAGYQDWGVFWHVAWSWAAMVFFFQHTWINRVAFAHFFRQSFATLGGAVTQTGAYLLLFIAFYVTWSDLGKDWFTVESYIPLSFYAWLFATVPAYAWWLWDQARTTWLRRAPGPANERRGRIDLALVPAAALATLSGIPLTFFDVAMDQGGWKYVSKYWHVWPSVLFCVLVFVHTMQTWNVMRAHWRNYGIALGDVPRPNAAQTSPRELSVARSGR